MQLKPLMTTTAQANWIRIQEMSSHLHINVRPSERGLIKKFTQITWPDFAQIMHLRNNEE